MNRFSCHWCADLARLRSLKMISTDSLEPLGSRTDIHSGTSGSFTMKYTISSTTSPRHQLRQQIRKIRQNLTALEQQQAAFSIQQQAIRLVEQRQAKQVAIYLSFDGELNTQPLIESLWQKEIQVALPVLHPFTPGHLLFLRYTPETVLQPNRYGILEPKLNVRQIIPTQQLDIIFTPIVACDKQGNRLGMGGGFYDRTLKNWQTKHFIPVGLAYRFQQIDHLPTEDWDIPLERILLG